MKKTGTFVVSFVLCFVLYIFLVRPFNTAVLAAGLALSAGIAILSSRHLNLPLYLLNPVRIVRFLLFLPYFVFEMVKANIKIALIVLNPKLPIRPELKRGKSKLKSPYGRVFLANSITLTPGTLTVEGNEKEFVIHCVNERRTAEDIIGAFEKRIERITE